MYKSRGSNFILSGVNKVTLDACDFHRRMRPLTSCSLSKQQQTKLNWNYSHYLLIGNLENTALSSRL